MGIFHGRKSKYVIIGILLIAAATAYLFYSGVLSFGQGAGLNPILAEAGRGLDRYEIEVSFDPRGKTLQCNQSVKYTNRTDKDLTHVYFHLYPNAFKYEEKPVFEKDEMSRAYPDGFSPGSIDIEQVSINGTPSEYIVGGYSDSLLMLLINGSLEPGGTMDIDMEYTVKLPNCLGRFGYGDSTYKAANWYPIACVYDENGWNLDRYYSIGDPFYSDVSNYKVTIRAPSDYVIAATGDMKAQKTKDGFTVHEIEAAAVRDFTWIASDKFNVARKRTGNTMVNSYHFTSDAGELALDYASAALEIFSEAFGTYPYNQFSVVESDFFIGGMEYPNIIMIDSSLYTAASPEWLELVTVHETAHQWWYGLVGNNQIRDAWIDEGLTEYSTVLYYGRRYGKEKEDQIYREQIEEGKYEGLQYYARTMDIDLSIHRPSYAFPDWIIYDLLVYGKGAMMFHELRQEIGDEMFYQALQDYYKQYRFRNVGSDEFIRSFESTTGRELHSWFEKWLYKQTDE